MEKKMFAQLYRETTDPTLSWYHYFCSSVQARILLSILFHIIIYTVAFNMAWWILRGRVFRANDRLVMILFIIMYLGYIGRLVHVQDIYRTFSEDRARAFTDQHYNTWVFLG